MSRGLVGSFTDFTLWTINHIASPPAYKLLLTSSVFFPLCPADSDRQTRMHSCRQPTNSQTTMNHLLPSQPLASLMLVATLLVSPLCASAQESRANANDAIRCTVGAQGGEPIDGLGVELDPHFLSANAAAGIGVKESDWDNVVVPRLRDLAFSKWRVMVLPWWY